MSQNITYLVNNPESFCAITDENTVRIGYTEGPIKEYPSGHYVHDLVMSMKDRLVDMTMDQFQGWLEQNDI